MPRLSLRHWVSRAVGRKRASRKRYAPSAANEITALLMEADGLLEALQGATPSVAGAATAAVKALEEGLQSVKRDVKDLLASDGTVDPDKWAKRSEPDRVRLYSDLWQITKIGHALNIDEIEYGTRWFFYIGVTLGGLVFAYALFHMPSHPKTAPPPVVEIASLLNDLDARVKTLRSKQPTPPPGTIPDISGKTVKPQEANDAEQFKRDAVKLRDKLVATNPTSPSLPFLNSAVAEVETNQIARTTTFETFRAMLEKELREREREAFDERAFWGHLPRRWLEIACWAEFGALVGLLFYIAGLLEIGLFRAEKTSTFVTEILAAPIVVPVVFFLFQFTGMTDPGKTSTTVMLGIAFVLGFSIRRTVGLLDIIKKKVLPEPEVTPASRTSAIAAKTATTTKVTSNPNPSVEGSEVTLTATVGAATGTPEGKVEFSVDGKTIETVNMTNGTATHKITSLRPDQHTVTARYVDSPRFAESTSAPITHTVTPKTP